jgi:ATP-binding cassette subfamily C protein LapB
LRAMGVWTQLQSVRIARARASAIAALKPEAAEPRPELPAVTGTIRLENIHLTRASGGTELFAGIDLDIAAGEAIAIRGENGTGRGVLLAIMMGLVRPTSGRVLFDGHDIAVFDPRSVRRQTAYVPRVGTLFRGTILDNLTGFRDGDAVERALQAAMQLGLDEAVARMPDGYQTRVGESSGEDVPGGVLQRIVVARALAAGAPIVLFDEANTHLDGAGNTHIRNALTALKGKATLVIVSLRPSLLNIADRAYDLRGGRLVEHVPPAAPAAAPQAPGRASA